MAAHTAPQDTSGPTDDYQYLISSLLEPETLTDDDLYHATAVAHAAITDMQDEYFRLDREISLLEPTHARKPDPRKLLDPSQYRAKHEKCIQDILQKIAKNGAEATASKTSKGAPRQKPFIEQPQPPPTSSGSSANLTTPPGRATKDQLIIDMNIEYPINIASKRERKPRMKFHGIEKETPESESEKAPNAPRSTRKRRRGTIVDDANNDELPQQVKRQATSAQPETHVDLNKEAAAGKDPKRSEAMRRVWAKRQAAGTNGRYGGAPKVKRARQKKE
ncbi:MAG: hypothetical protein Q9163_004772 [Psora crenata]